MLTSNFNLKYGKLLSQQLHQITNRAPVRLFQTVIITHTHLQIILPSISHRKLTQKRGAGQVAGDRHDDYGSNLRSGVDEGGRH